jgi:hypothetical protein
MRPVRKLRKSALTNFAPTEIENISHRVQEVFGAYRDGFELSELHTFFI